MMETPPKEKKTLKIKRKICSIPQSLNFRYNLLSNSHAPPCKTLNSSLMSTDTVALERQKLQPSEDFSMESSQKTKKNIENVLSSRVSETLLFHYRNSYLNEKIMRFNIGKNTDTSHRTNRSEFIIEKPLIQIHKKQSKR